jgi:prepilin-type processing-associated H-X9-DG protein
VFWVLVVIALLIAILLPSLMRARHLAKRAVCAANLRCICQSMHIYANDNEEWFPHHYYREPKVPSANERDVAVRWEGTMGSNEFLKITEQTTPQKSPDRSHPSRSLFMLVVGGNNAPSAFLCPGSRDVEDSLRNLEDGREVACMPGVNRFDFRGYDRLSYGYQLPYGKRAKPRNGMDPRMALSADKGPYYTSGGEALPGSGTVRDARSDVMPPEDWGEDAIRRELDAWRPYNSRNHNGEGQNVLFADCHVEFVKRPIVGVNYDNIYTLQTDLTPAGSWAGLVPAADRPVGPLTNTDNFIVP